MDDLHEYIEKTIIDRLRNSSETAVYNITPYHGAYSAELFVEDIKNKLQAGVDAIMVSCREIRSTQVRDTKGMVHVATATIEIVCASNTIKAKEFPDTHRHTSKMMMQVKKILAGLEFFINNRTVTCVWNQDESLFRIDQLSVDAQRMTYTAPGIMLYLT